MSDAREAKTKVFLAIVLLGALGGAVVYARHRASTDPKPEAPVTPAATLDASPTSAAVDAAPRLPPDAAALAEGLDGGAAAYAEADAAELADAGDAGEATDAGAIAKNDAGCPVYSYALGLRRGRELVAARRFDEAIRAFDEAVRARPYDARARAERAFVRMQQREADGGSGATGVAGELRLARALAKDRALSAQIAWNEALALEAEGSTEEARVALVRAAGLGPAAADKKLGTTSRCTVSVVSSGNDLPIETTWVGVLAKVAGGSTCEAPAATTEADARAYACGKCSGVGGAWTKGTCAGAGPWEIDAGYMHCSAFSARIQDLGGGRYWAPAGPGEQPRLERDGKVWVLREAERHFTWVTGQFADGDPTYRGGEGWTDQVEPASSGPRCTADETHDAELTLSTGCQASMGANYEDERRHVYYDDKGRWLAEIVVRDAGGARPAIKVGAAGLAIEGAGCKLDVPFAKR